MTIRRTLKLSASERQALIHADPATGRVIASGFHLRDELRKKGLAESAHRQLYLSEKGRRVRAQLMETYEEFNIAGVPWAKAQEITDLYLQGRPLEEISQRTRVTGDEITAVLEHRRVLPSC